MMIFHSYAVYQRVHHNPRNHHTTGVVFPRRWSFWPSCTAGANEVRSHVPGGPRYPVIQQFAVEKAIEFVDLPIKNEDFPFSSIVPAPLFWMFWTNSIWKSLQVSLSGNGWGPRSRPARASHGSGPQRRWQDRRGPPPCVLPEPAPFKECMVTL